jgi:hypothetical protein
VTVRRPRQVAQEASSPGRVRGVIDTSGLMRGRGDQQRAGGDAGSVRAGIPVILVKEFN